MPEMHHDVEGVDVRSYPYLNLYLINVHPAGHGDIKRTDLSLWASHTACDPAGTDENFLSRDQRTP